MRFVAASFLFAAACLCAAGTVAAADPPMIPAPGAKMIPNEYGGTFASEIIWTKDQSVMVLIPHGTYTRGLSVEHGGSASESPEREITIPSFYIDKYEVSNKQYATFVSEKSSARSRQSNKNLLGDDKPVSAIDWNSASAYATWVGKALPTESMWEKAARGPDGRVYTTGSEPPAKDTVIWGRGSIGETISVKKDTGDVNGFGLFHMGGNVSEWTSDWYLREAYANTATENPKGPESGETKVYRGGSFVTQKAEDTRTTRRQSHGFRQILDELGFRTVWVPVDPAKITPTPTPIAATPTLTPEKTNDELTEIFRMSLKEAVEKALQRLPGDMMASRAYVGRGEDEVQIVNLTPFELSLTFFGPDENLCFKYNEPVGAMTFKNILLPKERNLVVMAYASDAPRKGPLVVGRVRAESKIILVLQSELLSPVHSSDGTDIPIQEVTEAPQFYEGEYQPLWNVMEVFNAMDVQMVVKVEDITKGEKNVMPVGEYTMNAGEILRLPLTSGTYRYRADYIGAVDESGKPATVKIDDKAARRLVVVRVDKDRQGPGVTVITEKRPYVLLETREARRIPFTSSLKAPK